MALGRDRKKLVDRLLSVYCFLYGYECVYVRVITGMFLTCLSEN